MKRGDRKQLRKGSIIAFRHRQRGHTVFTGGPSKRGTTWVLSHDGWTITPTWLVMTNFAPKGEVPKRKIPAHVIHSMGKHEIADGRGGSIDITHW